MTQGTLRIGDLTIVRVMCWIDELRTLTARPQDSRGRRRNQQHLSEATSATT